VCICCLCTRTFIRNKLVFPVGVLREVTLPLREWQRKGFGQGDITRALWHWLSSLHSGFWGKLSMSTLVVAVCIPLLSLHFHKLFNRSMLDTSASRQNLCHPYRWLACLFCLFAMIISTASSWLIRKTYKNACFVVYLDIMQKRLLLFLVKKISFV
jgi:hypothetical protein